MRGSIYIVILTFLLLSCGRESQKEFYANGQLKREAQIKGGKLDGLYREYYENGQLRYDGTYKSDKRSGTYALYHKNGKIEESGTYVNDQVQGKVKTYYETGELYLDGFFENGQQSGELKEYYKDGNIKSIQSYINGTLHGDIVFYYPNGEIFLKGIKKNDTTIYYEEYSEAGEVLETYRELVVSNIPDTLKVGETLTIDFSYTGPVVSDSFLVSTLLFDEPDQEIQYSKSIFSTNGKIRYEYTFSKPSKYHLVGHSSLKGEPLEEKLHYKFYVKPLEPSVRIL